MKLQRTTWILVGVAMLLGGIALITETRQASERDAIATSTSESGSDLFAFEEEEIQAVTVQRPSQMLSFQKDEQGDWRMTAPESSLANEGTVVYLLNLLATSNAQNPTEIAPNQKADFGLEQPFATVKVSLNNGNSHTLILGGTNFDGASRYAIADPPDGAPDAADKMTVVLVPNSFASAIDRPTEDWQQVEMPAPSATEGSPDPSESPEPAPESSAEQSPSPEPAPEPDAELSPPASPTPEE